MGNTIGSKKVVKVMKINGETMKFKTPIHANEVIENYPDGHVLLESESVKHFGIRAKPLKPYQELKPKRLYFLVELPEFPYDKITRRVRSDRIHMTAKDRLESLMLARRSVSDLSILKPSMSVREEEAKESLEKGTSMRLKMKIPKSEVERLMKECDDEDELAAKIMNLCMDKHGNSIRSDGHGSSTDLQKHQLIQKNQVQENRTVTRSVVFKLPEKRVGFPLMSEGEIQLAVAS